MAMAIGAIRAIGIFGIERRINSNNHHHQTLLITSNHQTDTTNLQFSPSKSRRRSCTAVLLLLVMPFTTTQQPSPVLAREKRTRIAIPLENYQTTPDGLLKYYDVVQGNGPVALDGFTVQVHFDCLYHGITAISSRESKLLAGNRSIAQVYEFKVGAVPGNERKRDYVDNANGLFSVQASPKPPPAMYSITRGMRVGGKRTVIVPADAGGYGNKGMSEIPPGATFELNIELLKAVPPSPSAAPTQGK